MKLKYLLHSILPCSVQVNVASRMESTGIPGSIQVSADYAAETRAWMELKDRGRIEVKGKGQLQTFILLVRLPDIPPSFARLLAFPLQTAPCNAHHPSKRKVAF